MKIADQVCSPAQAQYFDSVGLKLYTQFYWVCFYDTRLAPELRKVLSWKAVNLDDLWEEFQDNPRYRDLKRYRAYNSAELGNLLPAMYAFFKSKQNTWLPYHLELGDMRMPAFQAPTEARAKGALLQRLIELGRVSVTELKYTSTDDTSTDETMGSTS